MPSQPAGVPGTAGGGVPDASGEAASNVELLLRRFAIACAPGLAWTSIGLPFDVVRVRLQTTSKQQFRGPLHCVRTTVSQEGIRALWKGFLPHLLISLPYSTLLFGVYGALRPPSIDPSANVEEQRRFYAGVFKAGFAAGIALTAFQNPLDVWRTRVQTTITPLHRQKNGPIHSPQRGVLSSLVFDPTKRHLLWRGISMTAMRNMPGNGVYFVVNEFMLSRLTGLTKVDDQLQPKQPSSWQRLLAGGVTGVVFNLGFMPADAIKARLMVSTPESAGGVRQIARAIVRDHGFSGFWRGGWVMFAKAAPVNAAGFWTLNAVQELLG